MLIFNQDLINLKQEEERKRKEYEAVKLRFDSAKKQAETSLIAKEQQLVQQVNNLYAREQYKFTAHLSDDKENIEIYSQGKIRVGLYTKENNQFKPLELKIVGLNKQEDIILGKTKAQLYQIMENIFR